MTTKTTTTNEFIQAQYKQLCQDLENVQLIAIMKESMREVCKRGLNDKPCMMELFKKPEPVRTQTHEFKATSNNNNSSSSTTKIEDDPTVSDLVNKISETDKKHIEKLYERNEELEKALEKNKKELHDFVDKNAEEKRVLKVRIDDLHTNYLEAMIDGRAWKKLYEREVSSSIVSWPGRVMA